MEQYKIDLTHLVVDCVWAKGLRVFGCRNVRKWGSPNWKRLLISTHSYSFLHIPPYCYSFWKA